MLPGSLAGPESTGWPEVFTSCFTPPLRLTQTTAGGQCVPVVRGPDDTAMCSLSVGTFQDREADVSEREPHTCILLPHYHTHVGSGNGRVANGLLIKNQMRLLLFLLGLH